MGFSRRSEICATAAALHVLVSLLEDLEPCASRKLFLLGESALFRLKWGSECCLRGQRPGFSPGSATGLLRDLACVPFVSGLQLSLLSSEEVAGWRLKSSSHSYILGKRQGKFAIPIRQGVRGSRRCGVFTQSHLVRQ